MLAFRLALAENSLSNGIQNRWFGGGREVGVCLKFKESPRPPSFFTPIAHLESPRLPWVSVIHQDPQKSLRAEVLTVMVYHSASIQMRTRQRKSTWQSPEELIGAVSLSQWTHGHHNFS